MTDREKLIELLGDFSTPVMLMDVKLMDWTIPTEHLRDSLTDYLIANGVRLEPKQTTSDENKRWIPVSERLPEKNENVLAWCDNEFSEVCYYSGQSWEKAWDNEEIFFVTHWMPLPEPPKEESK